MSAIEANVESVYGRATIHLKGYLSGDAPEPLEAAFAQAAGVQQILLVFQPQDSINSAGAAVLFDLVLPLKEQGEDVRVVHPSAHFRKVFDIIGLSKDVDVYASLEEAVSGW